MLLVETKLLSTVKGIELFEKLKIVNDSLPKEEIEKLIKKLRS
jgi:hypothetical protein